MLCFPYSDEASYARTGRHRRLEHSYHRYHCRSSTLGHRLAHSPFREESHTSMKLHLRARLYCCLNALYICGTPLRPVYSIPMFQPALVTSCYINVTRKVTKATLFVTWYGLWGKIVYGFPMQCMALWQVPTYIQGCTRPLKRNKRSAGRRSVSSHPQSEDECSIATYTERE